jgi:transposase, IS5 family
MGYQPLVNYQNQQKRGLAGPPKELNQFAMLVLYNQNYRHHSGWDRVPSRLQELTGELQRLDQILDDESFFEPCVKHFHTLLGRPTVPVEVYIRLMYLKRRYGLGYESLVAEVSDSLRWRRFCHLGVFEPLPEATTLIKSEQKYGPEAIRELNALLIEKCSEQKVIRSKKLRADTTVIAAAIHPPTDASLLGDGVRVITRTVAKIQALGWASKIAFRNRLRSTKRKLFGLMNTLRQKQPDIKAKLHRQIQALVSQTKRVVKEAVRVVHSVRAHLGHLPGGETQQARQRLNPQAQRLARRLAQDLKTTQRVVEQTRQVLGGVRHLPDRIVSLFDTQARPIKRGKLDRPTEFGYKLYLQQTGEQLISHYQV